MKAYGFCVVAVTSAALAQAPATQPALEIPVERQSLFFDPEDGAFDVSGFLATRTGFLPIAMPITEPAVEGGLAAGLAFFHGKPHRKQSGERTRVIMPSITAVFGFGTFNESYGGGAAHLGSWNEGRIRYLGGRSCLDQS